MRFFHFCVTCEVYNSNRARTLWLRFFLGESSHLQNPAYQCDPLMSSQLFPPCSKVSTLLWSLQLETAGLPDLGMSFLTTLTAATVATAGGLAVGAPYVLCVDLDGDGPLPLGPTGLEARWILVVGDMLRSGKGISNIPNHASSVTFNVFETNRFLQRF